MFSPSPTKKIGIIGLGYVGLPLAAEFGKYFDVVGFDINKRRIEQLRDGFDATLEVNKTQLTEAAKLSYSCDENDLTSCNIFIVTVPTPIDDTHAPDLILFVKRRNWWLVISAVTTSSFSKAQYIQAQQKKSVFLLLRRIRVLSLIKTSLLDIHQSGLIQVTKLIL